MLTVHAEIGVPNAGGHRDLVLVAAGGGPEELAYAAKLLSTLPPLFSKSDPPGALITPLSWATIVQLQALFSSVSIAWVPGPALCTWIEEQVMRRMSPAVLSYIAPTGLEPRPYQVAGARMIASTGGALITDEPGTGKTITTIIGLVEWASVRHAAGPVVVLCPASVIDSWVTAWQTWAPHVRAVAWRGSKRKALAGTADVYVTSYETARIDVPQLKHRSPLLELGPVALVIDECHLVKNPQAARSKSVMRLAERIRRGPSCVVALSGTPITHHPGNLWPTLACIDPVGFKSSERWVRRYCSVLQGAEHDEVLGLAPYAEAEFHLTLLGQERRVAKADVLTQLPPKVYTVRTVDMPAEWRKVYDDFESQMFAELPQDDGSVAELSVMDVMSKFGFLTRLAAAAADVEVTFGPDIDDFGQPKRHVHLHLKAPKGSRWKVDALLEVLEERQRDESRTPATGGAPRCEPVVVFAPSRQLVMLAGAAAEAAGYRVGYIVGGQAASARTAAMEAFQHGDLDVICVTTGAGGTGITLTAARTVVFLQRPWSIVESIQAEDRCHRIGSEIHDSIEIVDVVTRNTIDTRVRAVLRERAGQLADLVRDPRIVAELLGGTTAQRAELLSNNEGTAA